MFVKARLCRAFCFAVEIGCLRRGDPRVTFLPVVLRGAILMHRKLCAWLLEIGALRHPDGIAPGFNPKNAGGSYPEKQSRKASLR
jgi:hypothetical protein